ncbi:MAG TPA: DUF5667 domain-containing protein [Candidatus Paceibacterota bacterium]|nr:DUF5667 domain-containing protein [Candidatus Paceibacterota bacterium]
MKYPIFKNKKLPTEAKKSLQPRKEFLTQGKQRFLAAFDASPLAAGAGAASGVRPSARLSGWTLFLRVGTGTVAAIAIAFGMSAYAATAGNVSPTNPLYPLKRLVENVQLAVAPAQAKAQLQATFAVQRANEIDALQVQHPSSTLIPRLTVDLDSEISSSLAAASSSPSSNPGDGNTKSGAGNGTAGSVGVFCAAFTKSTSSVLFGHLEGDLVLHPSILAQFNAQCGSDSPRDGNTEGGAASTTVNSVEPITPGDSRGHGHHYGGNGDAATGTGSGAVTAVPSVSTPSIGITASTTATANATVTPPIIGTASTTIRGTSSSSASSSGGGDGSGAAAGGSAGAGTNVSAPSVPPVTIPSLGGIL